jgi:molybdopterin/thiamine biosynthesis adenylyltransferase
LLNRPQQQYRSERSGAVLVVGVGALGCPALAALARARLKKLAFVDPDRVELSNLPPQLLYDTADVGRPKVEAAAARLAGKGPQLEPIDGRLDENNAHSLISSHDFIVDCCDDPATKFLVNRVAVRAGRPFCYAGLSRTGGLSLTVEPGVSPCLACVFPQLGDMGAGASRDFGCHETGIIAPVAAVLGSYQALQALGALGLAEPPAAGRLAVYQLRGRRWAFIEFKRDSRCGVCGVPRTENLRRMDSCHS